MKKYLLKSTKFYFATVSLFGVFYLSSNLIVAGKVISADTIRASQDEKKYKAGFWDTFEKKFGNRTFYSVSIPLFSEDKSIAPARVNYYCKGTCGNGGIYLFKRSEKGWLKIETLRYWIN